MIDYLLKFPSKDVAIQFGASTGLASQDEDGNWQASTATHNHCLLEIGEYNGSDYWILYRDFTGIPVPEGADQFIYWCSEWTTGEGDDTHPVPRPTDDTLAPTVFWA
jgi:hypothetical protein